MAAFAFGALSCSVQASDEAGAHNADPAAPSGAEQPAARGSNELRAAPIAALGSTSSSTPCTPSSPGVAHPSGWRDMDFTGQEWAFGSRYLHAAVWDGREMLVFGGAVGSTPVAAAYDPTNDKWAKIPDAPLIDRVRHAGVWTGHAMLIFGGETPEVLSGDEVASHPLSDGATYDPCTEKWRSISPAPFSWRRGSSAVWATTTQELVLFGGLDGSKATNEGWAYSTTTDRWRKLAPSPLAARSRHAATWTGATMIVYGGYLQDGTDPRDAAAYDPASDRWTMLPAPPTDAPRGEDAVATGSDLSGATFWGGRTSKTADDGTGQGYFSTNGATFDATTSTWSSIPAPASDVLSERWNATVWYAQGKLFVFSGDVAHDVYDPASHTAQDGAYFDFATKGWTRIGRPLAYVMREGASVVWTGREAILLGGRANCVMCNPLPTGGVVFTP